MKDIINHKKMTTQFKGLCAVSEQGECWIASGYENDNSLRAEIAKLKKTSVIPASLNERFVSPESIADAYNENKEVVMVTDQLVQRITAILLEATNAKASDVIFELVGESCIVSALVNDMKIPIGKPLVSADGDGIMRRLFEAREQGGGQTTYQKNKFQGFSIRPGKKDLPLPEGISGIRGQRGPHEPDGDHMFLRLFYKNSATNVQNLEGLGFDAEQCAIFQEARATRQGALIIGGTTGDGKSTTLTVNLNQLVKETSGQLNIITVEDPVENDIPGVIQIPVPTGGDAEERDENMKDTLRHFVRIHPSVGMVSEVRDIEGALAVLQFVDTGHPVHFTIHVSNANAILYRLMDLGVPAPQVCKPGNIALLVKQAIVPLLCDACSVSEAETDNKLAAWLVNKLSNLSQAGAGENQSPHLTLRRRNPNGCDKCNDKKRNAIAALAWAGYERSRAVAEMISPDDEYLSYVARNDAIGSKKYWLEKLGGVPIEKTVAGLVRAGKVDPMDAIGKGIRFYDHMEEA